jgi:hypothetical protein
VPVKASKWTREDLLVAGGAVVGLAATADTVRSLYDRFAADLAGLSTFERAGVALWDLRPLGAAVFAGAALALAAGLPRLEAARPLLVVLLSGYAALGAAVLALAVWIAVRGSVGAPDELGFRFTDGARAVTLATQAAAWGPLMVLFAALALRIAARPEPGPTVVERASISEEMDALWREELAFGPKRERARGLLGRIRELEAAGDDEAARALAEEMRRL